jgi:hypothetical protein
MTKCSPPEKYTSGKKELLTLAPGNIADGKSLSQWRWWWVRTSWANHKSMWQRFGVLRVKGLKAKLNRQPSAYSIPVWGLGSHLTPVKWYGNRWLMQNLQWIIRPTQRTAQNFIFTGELVYIIFYSIVLALGKMTNSQDWFPAMQEFYILLLFDQKLISYSLSV